MPNYQFAPQTMPASYMPAYGGNAWQMPQFMPQYSQQQAPQFAPQQPAQQPRSGLNWCQGIEGAKGTYVAPGFSELIMDSEGPVFYIKAVDASGVPAPLRIFRYTEESAQIPAAQNADYVTRKELPGLIAQVIAQQAANGGAESNA